MKYLFHITFFFLSFHGYTQCNYAPSSPEFNCANISVINGGHIDFHFNSIAKYQTGVSVINGTTIGVRMGDNLTAFPAPASTLTGWHLDVQTFGGATDLIGSSGATLPSETIQIEATDANGNLAGATFNGLLDLTAGGNTLMSTTVPGHIIADPSTHQINISYHCGTTPTTNLLGATGDYYTIEVELVLIPDF